MQWTEITDENMDAVYNMNPDRLVIASKFLGMVICKMNCDWAPTISTMAKHGGYYYIELPELNINDNDNDNYGE